MHRRVPAVMALCILATLASPAVAAGPIDPASRSATLAGFVVRWSQTNPEAITYLSWNASPNLTNTWARHPNCPDTLHEFFGNAWGGESDAAFVSPVGWGGSGRWSPSGDAGVGIEFSASGCYGTSGIKVRTTYAFANHTNVGRMQVERRFAFGNTPFASDFRPYIPRLYPASTYAKIYFPNSSGTILSERGVFDCGLGCRVFDWTGDWFALHDPAAGRGVIVRHESDTHPAELWIDDDGGAATTATSVLLRQSGAGFTGTVVDRQILCFYDSMTGWTPSLTLPAGCTAGWSELPTVSGSKHGLSSSAGAYTPETKVANLGKYVTWQADMGAAAAGKSVGVWIATRAASGTWSPFVRQTGRTADAFGAATFSWRESKARWISVRFSVDDRVSSASQARWR